MAIGYCSCGLDLIALEEGKDTLHLYCPECHKDELRQIAAIQMLFCSSDEDFYKWIGNGASV